MSRVCVCVCVCVFTTSVSSEYHLLSLPCIFLFVLISFYLSICILALRELVKKGSEQGIEMVVFGMAHRGRLNVLHNVLNKKMEVILNEFKTTLAPDDEVCMFMHRRIGSLIAPFFTLGAV